MIRDIDVIIDNHNEKGKLPNYQHIKEDILRIIEGSPNEEAKQ